MTFEQYDSAKAFAGDTMELLLENEAQNNIMIANALRGEEKPNPNWFYASVKNEAGSVLLSALCTPPFNLTLYETGNRRNDEALSFFVKEISELDAFPGILAEESLANRFAQSYAAQKNFTVQSGLKMNLLKLTRVEKKGNASGGGRWLMPDDLFFVPYWEIEFSKECGVHVPELREHIEKIGARVSKQTHLIWEDGIPVSQAVCGRKTVNGAVMNGVYTPPQYRGKGYATSCVAALSQAMLESGSKFCMLFADTANPISNGIYNQIGYRQVCVSQEVLFKMHSI